MGLLTIDKYDSDYKQNILGGHDIKNYTVYANTSGSDKDKVGSVHDVIVDESGYIRYLVVDTGFWVFGKKVLLPIGRCQFDYSKDRVYASGLTKQQVENLPKYDDDMTVDYDYEEKVRGVYRSSNYKQNYDRNSYRYDLDADLYSLSSADHGVIKLYEERLIANKSRQKVGEVAVGKRVEEEVARASVPVEKDRVVIERATPTGGVQPVAPGEANFREGEVARVDIYEEKAEIQKQAYVSEEVDVRKQVEQDTVSAEETLRREELKVDVDGKPVIKRERDR